MSPSKSSPLKNLGFKRSPVKRLDFGMEKKRKRTDSESVDGFITKFPRCQSEILNSTVPDARAFNSRTRSELNLSQNRQLKELTTNHKKVRGYSAIIIWHETVFLFILETSIGYI